MANLKGHKANIKPPRMKPKCKEHRKDLKYNPDNVRWECPEENCTVVKHPSVDNEGRPVVGKGKTHLLRQTDDKGHENFYLRTDNNVIIRIDHLLVNRQDRRNKTYLTIACDSEIEIEI